MQPYRRDFGDFRNLNDAPLEEPANFENPMKDYPADCFFLEYTKPEWKPSGGCTFVPAQGLSSCMPLESRKSLVEIASTARLYHTAICENLKGDFGTQAHDLLQSQVKAFMLAHIQPGTCCLKTWMNWADYNEHNFRLSAWADGPKPFIMTEWNTDLHLGESAPILKYRVRYLAGR